jgi:hypothetical protein
MIDSIYIEVRGIASSKLIENHILRENGFAEILANEDTGEMLGRGIAKYKGLTFKVLPSLKSPEKLNIIISGSLHKYHNEGEHNHNRFTLNDCVKVVNDLVLLFGIDPTKCVLHGLEFGVNLNLPYSPTKVFYSMVAHKNKPYEAMQGKRRWGVECERNEYELKIYDKGYQSDLFGSNILRVEYKVLKMRKLAPYGISLLSDLCDPLKVAPLIDLLIEVIDDTIFIPRDTKIDGLTDREKSNFHEMGKPITWKELTPKQRFDKKTILSRILKKCNGFDYQNDVKNRIVEEWKICLNLPIEAEKKVMFSPCFEEKEAHENVTFSPLGYQVKTLRNPLEIENEKIELKTTSTDTPPRTCKSCGKSILLNRADSVFCSEKYNLSAKQCRNKDSNKRRTFKAQIMRAKEKDKYIRVTYKNLDDPKQELETVTLRGSEIAVSRGWLNTMNQIYTVAPTNITPKY